MSRPKKGSLEPGSARRRLLARPRGSLPKANRLMAEPEGRQRRRRIRREKVYWMTSTDLDRSTIGREVFGKLWLNALFPSRN